MLQLPVEIRLQVYHQTFVGTVVRANPRHYLGTNGAVVSLQKRARLVDIFLTCRAVYAEARVVFYSLAKFKFERYSTDDINWSLEEIENAFPELQPTDGYTVGINAREVVQEIYYAGSDARVMHQLPDLFPDLKTCEFDLDWDHLGSDQTNFDRAMKYAIRNREWRHAIEDALDQRFPDEMKAAIIELRNYLKDQQNQQKTRTLFKVILHWRLAYRFVEFEGECDLAEWILRVRDPDGVSKNVYEIRQDEFTVSSG